MSKSLESGVRGRDRLVLSCGYIALDIILYEGKLSHRAGGTAANVAANLAYLGWEAAVLGLIGEDNAGKRLTSDLNDAGVESSGLGRMQSMCTPRVIHEILPGGHRFRFRCPDCGSRFPRYRPPPVAEVDRLLRAGKRADVFFFDRASKFAVSMAEAFRSMGRLVVFEPSSLGHESLFQRALTASHIVKYSEERAGSFESHAQKMLGGSKHVVIVTKGADGARVRVGKRWRDLPPFGAYVVDAGGAGDWMTAGLLWTLPSVNPEEVHEHILEALKVGQALASASCGLLGARGLSDYLARNEVDAWVNEIISKGSATKNGHPEWISKKRRVRSGCKTCLMTT